MGGRPGFFPESKPSNPAKGKAVAPPLGTQELTAEPWEEHPKDAGASSATTEQTHRRRPSQAEAVGAWAALGHSHAKDNLEPNKYFFLAVKSSEFQLWS